MPKINFPYVLLIIRSYVPDLIVDDGTVINMELFRMAMNHVSNDNDNNYERLEFLGDAIFHVVVSEYLFDRYDEQNRGFLSKLRISIEKGESMAFMAKQLKMNEYIQIKNNAITDKIIEDVFEAFICAFYINFGFVHTKTLIIGIVEKYKDMASIIDNDNNYKNILLAYFHQMKWGNPVYESTYSRGIFDTEVRNPDDDVIGFASASIKKDSEQGAAMNALIELGIIINGEIDHDWIDKIDKTEEDKDSPDPTQPIHNIKNIAITKDDIFNLLAKYNTFVLKKQINQKTFQESMTHVSYVKRKKLTEEDAKLKKICVPLQAASNNRLRFLGDSVIHLVFGEYLFHTFPNENQGGLTNIRSRMENELSLFGLAKKTGIDKYVLINTNIESIHGRNGIKVMSRGFEAFIAAVYLNFGLDDARTYLVNIIKNSMDMTEIRSQNQNYKEIVAIHCRRLQLATPKYKLLEEKEVDKKKIFVVAIYCLGKLAGKGTASQKRKAEQLAAKMMYERSIKQ